MTAQIFCDRYYARIRLIVQTISLSYNIQSSEDHDDIQQNMMICICETKAWERYSEIESLTWIYKWVRYEVLSFLRSRRRASNIHLLDEPASSYTSQELDMRHIKNVLSLRDYTFVLMKSLDYSNKEIQGITGMSAAQTECCSHRVRELLIHHKVVEPRRISKSIPYKSDDSVEMYVPVSIQKLVRASKVLSKIDSDKEKVLSRVRQSEAALRRKERARSSNGTYKAEERSVRDVSYWRSRRELLKKRRSLYCTPLK